MDLSLLGRFAELSSGVRISWIPSVLRHNLNTTTTLCVKHAPSYKQFPPCFFLHQFFPFLLFVFTSLFLLKAPEVILLVLHE